MDRWLRSPSAFSQVPFALRRLSTVTRGGLYKSSHKKDRPMVHLTNVKDDVADKVFLSALLLCIAQMSAAFDI